MPAVPLTVLGCSLSRTVRASLAPCPCHSRPWLLPSTARGFRAPLHTSEPPVPPAPWPLHPTLTLRPPHALTQAGAVAGVAFSKTVGVATDNIGYVIPHRVVDHFLQEVESAGTVGPRTAQCMRTETAH
jgi:hypothetical protein